MPDDTGSVWDNVTFDESTDWKRAQVAIALGATPNPKTGAVELDLEIDPDVPGTSIGTEVLLKVRSGKNQDGDYRAEVQWVQPFEPGETGSAFNDDDAGDEPFDDDMDAAEPFDDIDGTTEDTSGDDEMWTEQGLRDLSPKELAEECQAFDLDPAELKVFTGRGKARKVNIEGTVDSMVAAILEAQNGPEEGQDGDDEDPF